MGTLGKGIRMDLSGLKVGDLVAYNVRRLSETPDWRIHKITKITPKRIYIHNNRDHYDRQTGKSTTAWFPGKSVREIVIPTESIFAEVAAKESSRREAENETAAFLAREDVRIVNELMSTPEDSWLAMGIDRLRKIADIVNAE